MESDKFDVNELSREKDFWALVRLVLNIKFNVENLLIPLIAFAVVLCLNMLSVGKSQPISSEVVASMAKDLVGWYYTILGFLIAGYTVFASVTSVDLSAQLAKKKNPETGLSWLKYIHAMFFKTILIFFFSSMYSLFLVLLLRKFAGYEFVVNGFGQFKIVALSIADALDVAFFVLSMMMLKSFLFNIYSSVMIAVGMKIVNDEKKRRMTHSRYRLIKK